MKLSARNQLLARVTGITPGKVNGTVNMELPCGSSISANISMKAIELLELVPDKTVYAVIKATEVMIASEPVKISARNQVPGRILELREGLINGIVLLDIGKGQQISSTISMEAVRELGLKKDRDVFAVFKSKSVMVGLGLDHISFGLM